MNFATKLTRTRIKIWIIWLAVLIIALLSPFAGIETQTLSTLLPGIVTHHEEDGALFPWRVRRRRWKKWALRRYRAWQKSYRQAKQTAMLAKLALKGMLPIAWVVEHLTVRQHRYQIGAIPVLYALLETLEVRRIINRYCPTQGDVDHGAVSLVLVINRLTFPLPLYRVADWVGQTVLTAALGVPAAKFNDDRLERTLDALEPHLEAIWIEIVTVALRKADVDLSVIFYDLTAFAVHGRYADSKLIDFGFAHNTPNDKRKFKLSLNTLADGNLPGLYRLWSGRTADQATVQSNMQNLAQWLKDHGQDLDQTLVVGDRAMMNAEIAVTYDRVGLRHLTGLKAHQKEHRALLKTWNDEQFEACPIVPEPDPRYWGRGCTVTFTHEGHTVTHKGLVVVSGPLRDQFRLARKTQLQELDKELAQVRNDIGQPRLRTIKAIKRRVNARLRASKTGHLMDTTVYQTPTGQVNITWQINKSLLAQEERLDGRYLLVTNDWSLSHQEIFRLYREKDGGEKRFLISKSDLKVTPIYLHKDRRIAAMLMLNMVALLAYSILERQTRQQGLQLTTRQIIQQLQNLTLIETHFIDGSLMRRLTPISPECFAILQLVAAALETLVEDVSPTPGLTLSLPPPLRLPTSHS
ncbi:MAG: IS1634 family transposase [Anaerolineales bacterium]|uniref:IS1634 family transposase n=1 Tax=Candidatus Desulfolinea nitratireducens TaxID=2841698 RepID=A0A8J6NLH2_9CHLR|nr:IS1634 family transposase [Candidatus Desulfolinea nitratireducens]MBL6961074.1 IS1634 family transposase [Anaerolineales bacterium]